jgi:sialidase-1
MDLFNRCMAISEFIKFYSPQTVAGCDDAALAIERAARRRRRPRARRPDRRPRTAARGGPRGGHQPRGGSPARQMGSSDLVLRRLALFAVAATGAAAAAADVQTLWKYRPSKHGSSGAGNWWGPSFAITNNGTVLLAALGKCDPPHPPHATPTWYELRRSFDGGKSWHVPSKLLYDGCASTVFSGGQLVHSATSDTTFFLYAEPGNGAPPGNISMIRSRDQGATWSEPTVLTGIDGKPLLSSGFVAHGLQLKHGPHKGRLVVTSEIFQRGTPKSVTYAIFSDSDGRTWQAGGQMPHPGNLATDGESAIAELHNGSLLITSRHSPGDPPNQNACNGTYSCRQFARSDNGGDDWVEAWHLPLSALPVHQCESAMTSTEVDGRTHLFFGFPMNTTTGDRTNYTIYSSVDGGKQWRWNTGVFPGPSGYSDMVALRGSGSGAASVRLGVAFQIGHNLPHVEGGGYDMGYSVVEATVHYAAAAAAAQCTDDLSCSLNGVCTGAGTCECIPPWHGQECELLKFKPVTFPQGYGMAPNFTTSAGSKSCSPLASALPL